MIKTKLKKNWFVVSKMTKIWWILIRALIIFDLNNFFMTLQSDAKIEKNLTCGLENNMRNLAEQLTFSKLGLWWDSFVESWKYISLKFTGELSAMKMKNDSKIEKELTCQFKIDIENLTNFDPSNWKSQNLHFTGLSLIKVYNVWVKKSTEELCLMALKTDAKFEGKLICAFKNDMRNLRNFHQSTWKSRNRDFDGIHFSKIENVLV